MKTNLIAASRISSLAVRLREFSCVEIVELCDNRRLCQLIVSLGVLFSSAIDECARLIKRS